MEELKPIVNLDSLDKFGTNITQPTICIDENDIIVDSNKVNIDTASLYDMTISKNKVFTLGRLYDYLNVINLGKCIYLNKRRSDGELMMLYCTDDGMYLIQGNNSIQLELNLTDTEIDELVQSVRDQAETTNSRLNNIYNRCLSSYKSTCHELKDKGNIADYVAFSTFKTKTNVEKVLESRDEYPIKFNSHICTYDDGIIIWAKETYKYIDIYTKDIPTNYGDFIDMDIIYKYNGEKKIINKKVTLYQDTMRTSIYDNHLEVDDSNIITFNGNQCTFNDVPISVILYNNVLDHIFDVIFDYDKLVLYSMSDKISEYYISSCRVHKIPNLEEENG